MTSAATRTWNDANTNYVPDCDLNNFSPNGECGQIDNRAFGTVVVNTRYADDVLKGFGNRGFNWQTSASVQHELRPGMAVNVGFYRTSFGNFTQVDNQYLTLRPRRYPAGGMSTGHSVTQCVNPDLPTVQFCTIEPPFTQLLHLFNQNDALVINTRFGPSWQIPSNVLGARLFKLGAQVDF